MDLEAGEELGSQDEPGVKWKAKPGGKNNGEVNNSLMHREDLPCLPAARTDKKPNISGLARV
jgi:hypothetical protein